MNNFNYGKNILTDPRVNPDAPIVMIWCLPGETNIFNVFNPFSDIGNHIQICIYFFIIFNMSIIQLICNKIGTASISGLQEFH